MRLAIVHYHLRRGGVTRVIESALQGLKGRVEAVVVLSSTGAEDPLPCPVAVVPELAYTDHAAAAVAEALCEGLRKGAREALGGDPDLWHIHNHSLGKNVNFPEAMRRLAGDGARLLLQIHDFAEDGRPGNYSRQREPYTEGVFPGHDASLYPLAPQIGYAVLNGRDREILLQAGVPAERLFLLPNAVTTPPLQDAEEPETGETPLILYPTRAIRRKNLGELLLMATAFRSHRFATSLSPKNPQWASFYRGWVDLARELDLPVRFALGEQPGQTFGKLVASARAMVTTSVGEGFGLAFLEPWLFGKPVCGRDLPEVTMDFRENGIVLADLYETWKVPVGLLQLDTFHQRFFDKVNSVYATYGKSFPRERLRTVWEELLEGDRIDFGLLDETAQAEVLRGLALKKGGDIPGRPLDLAELDSSVIGANARRIREAYGIDRYGKSLHEIYHRLLEAGPAAPSALDSNRILEGFLDLKRFRLLRT
ncbi:MAG: glycosyltransferase family 4 protein [Oceanipulchritudo sp.]